eukprot:CAMPEP_0172480036 /NCGR_PEP_ID=MMETSP1066-20121228/4934_1 /TAXON_ID=671091 /ORGANISM="Coscinodiscus wailesii, Strain CCMP2513" /LENGTH=134 /DNA_ID=CAMNT_0013240985 /DNA_START=186 /DNA_END=588 /DNA_ORIENTATION=+
MFFSPVVKNNLFDYERVTDIVRKKRSMDFGKYARIAGTMDDAVYKLSSRVRVLRFGGCHGMIGVRGTQNCVEGLESAFTQPIAFAFTGQGNVTQGVMEMFVVAGSVLMVSRAMVVVKTIRYSGRENQIFDSDFE